MTRLFGIGLPNLLTLLRMVLIPLFIIALLEHRPGRALIVFCLAGVTDALDGFIARFFDQATALGAYLDPVADKLLLTSAFVVLAVPGMHPGLTIPLWITVLVLARDILILVMALMLHLVLSVSRFPPSLLSKGNTAAQLLSVALVLGSGVTPGLASWALSLLYLTATLTVFSGLDYLRRAVLTIGERGRA